MTERWATESRLHTNFLSQPPRHWSLSKRTRRSLIHLILLLSFAVISLDLVPHSFRSGRRLVDLRRMKPSCKGQEFLLLTCMTDTRGQALLSSSEPFCRAKTQILFFNRCRERGRA